nr:reverse transcriptase domain-containing protein [Tanacetum cinerariifolium]
MSTQQDIYVADSENHPPMLNKDNYVPWSSRIIRYARSRPNGKMIVNFIENGPYVRRMIATSGEPDLPVPVLESLHKQTDEELTETDIKWMDADDQAIQTILLGLPEDVYAAVDKKKAKLFNEWEKFTSTDEESIESYYHRFMQLMNDLKRNKHFPKNIASNLKFLNNLQPKWKRHVTIVRQTKNLHEADFTQIYDFLKMNVMSSSPHSTIIPSDSVIENTFSSTNILNYFSASPGSISPDSSNNFTKYLLDILVFFPLHDDSKMEVIQAYDTIPPPQVKEKQENDKIETKPDRNGKRGKARQRRRPITVEKEENTSSRDQICKSWKSSSKLSRDQTFNPTSSTNTTPKGRTRRSSKQKVKNSNFEEHLPHVATMADNRTMVEMVRAPTKGPRFLECCSMWQFVEKKSSRCVNDHRKKSKVRNSRSKLIASPVNACDINSSYEIAKLTYAVNQQTSDVTTVMTAMLKQLQATPPPAPVKVVEEICVTCGGVHPYYQCLAVGGNTFPEFRDNIQGYVSAAASNYNQGNLGYRPQGVANQMRPPGPGSLPSNTVANPKGELKAITTRSGLVTDGPIVPTLPKSITPEVDEHVEETYTDPDLAEYTIKELANTTLNENCSAVILKKLPEKLGDPRKFLIPCGFNKLKCKALADLGASINLMPLSVWKELGLPDLIPTHMTLELANRAICTPDGIARDVFIPVGKFTFPADFIVVDYESDPRVPLILRRPFLRTARALIDVHGEEMILRDGDKRITLNMK